MDRITKAACKMVREGKMSVNELTERYLVEPKDHGQNLQAALDLRKSILNGTLDMNEPEDRLIAQDIFDGISVFAHPILEQFHMEPSESGTVHCEATKWDMDNPIRLTGDSLGRDYLAGPRAMADDLYQNKYAEGRNYLHEEMVRELTEERFLRFLENIKNLGIAAVDGDEQAASRLKFVSNRYWDEVIKKKDSRNYRIHRKTKDTDYLWFTSEQKSVIAHAFHVWFKPNNAYKKTIGEYYDSKHQEAFEEELSDRGLEETENIGEFCPEEI